MKNKVLAVLLSAVVAFGLAGTASIIIGREIGA